MGAPDPKPPCWPGKHKFATNGMCWKCDNFRDELEVRARLTLGVLYYESHITMEPVFYGNLEMVRRICSGYDFRVADLLMLKNRAATSQRSDKDTFCTGRGDDYDALELRMLDCCHALQEAGVKVWRRKIEAILYDERTKE